MNGYDNVLSIEHEDSLMAGDEGLKKAFAVLKEAIISKKPGPMTLGLNKLFNFFKYLL